MSHLMRVPLLVALALSSTACSPKPAPPPASMDSTTVAAPSLSQSVIVAFPQPYPTGVSDPMKLSVTCRNRVLQLKSWFRTDGAVPNPCKGAYTKPGNGPPPPPPPGPSLVHVDSTTTYQTWRGWGARFTGGSDQLGFDPATRAAIILDVVQHSGVTSIGMNLDNKAGLDLPGMDSVITQWIIPLKQEIGSDFKLTVRVQGVPLTDPELRLVLGRMTTMGLMPDYWIVKNEPNIGKNNTLTIAEVAAASSTACLVFRSMGLKTKLISAPLSHVPGSVQYGAALKVNPALAGCNAEYGYHMYSGWTPANLQQMGALGNTSMDEFHGAPITNLMQSLQLANLTHWQRDGIAGKIPSGWALYYALNGGPTWYLNQASAYQLQFQIPIRPGMVRWCVTSDSARLNPVAFGGGGRYAVVVQVKTAGPVTISGLPAGNYHVMTTLGPGTWSGMSTRPDANDAVDGGLVPVASDGILRATLAGTGYLSVWK